MADPSNRSPSARANRRTLDTNSAARRSFKCIPFSRAPHRGFNPVTPANSPDSGRRMADTWGYDEKENDFKVKLRSPKNFMAPTISASSKINPSPKKKILVERSDPVRTSMSFSDGKATLFSANSLEVGKSLDDLTLPFEDVLPISKTPRKVTFSEVPSNYCQDYDSLVSSELKPPPLNGKNYESLVSTELLSPKTNDLYLRPEFIRYKPNPKIHVYKRLVEADEMMLDDDSFISEILSELVSDTDGSENSDSLKESNGECLENFSDNDVSESSLTDDSSKECVSIDEEEPKVQSAVEMVEAKPTTEPKVEPKVPSAVEAKVGTKPRSSALSRFFCLLLLLIIVVIISVSVTDSPMLPSPGSIPLRYSNLTIPSDIPVLTAKASSYFKDSEEFDDELESFKSETEVDEEEVHTEADLDDDSEVELEEACESEIEEASAIQFTEEQGERHEMETEQVSVVVVTERNEFDISEACESEIEEASAIQFTEEQGERHEMETEQVSVAVVTEPSEFDISEGDLEQELRASHVQLELAETKDFIYDNDISSPELAETKDFIYDNDISSSIALESVNDNLEGSVKDDSATEDAQPSELIQSPVDRHGDNVGLYLIMGISSLLVAAVTVVWVRKCNKTVNPADQVLVKEKHSSQSWPAESDDDGESCPSEKSSSFQISSSCSKKYPRSLNDDAQSREKKIRKTNRRESLGASEYSIGSAASYGSFTTYERIPMKHASAEKVIITPVRRSSRIRSHVTSS